MHIRLEALVVLPLVLAPELVAQDRKQSADKSPPNIPTISARSYTGGSIRVTTTGAFQLDRDIPINHQASYSDGEKTWLQFGASGSKEGDVLITYGDGEIGIIFGKGSSTATAERQHCTGQADVTANSIDGHYSCKGVTAYDRSTGKMSPVAVIVTFTAKS
jgi:hypothetical protein